MNADECYALIRAKLERAKKHFGELDTELRGYLDSNPYRVEAKRDPETRRPVYFLASVAPLPAAVPLIIGDILQNSRSTLDHLIYQLLLVDTPRMVDPHWVAVLRHSSLSLGR